jgi:hypothetical protein
MSLYDKEPDLSLPNPSNSIQKSEAVVGHNPGVGIVAEAVYDGTGSDRMVQDSIAPKNRPRNKKRQISKRRKS